MCRLSWNLGTSPSWNPQCLYRDGFTFMFFLMGFEPRTVQPVKSHYTSYCSRCRQILLKSVHTWSDSNVRELIAIKVLHTSLLNTTAVTFKVLPLGCYAPMPAPSPPFKTILEMVLWNGLQSCRCITPDVINIIKMPSFQYFFYLREQKSHWRLDPMNRQGVPT